MLLRAGDGYRIASLSGYLRPSPAAYAPLIDPCGMEPTNVLLNQAAMPMPLCTSPCGPEGGRHRTCAVLTACLRATGRPVYPINPMTVAR
jgi:hypothetical protein